MRVAVILVLFFSPRATRHAPLPGPVNPLLQQLLDKGLLPAPMMKDGLTAKQQQDVLEKAAGTRPLELFVKKTAAAPFSLKINSASDGAGKRAVRLTLDLAFVAFGPLERVIKEDVLNQLIGTEAKKGKDASDVKILSADMMRTRGIEELKGPNLEERYAALDIFLLDRVKITGVTRNVKTFGPGWIALAMQLDPRFENDKEYPNRWRSFDPLEDVFGPPQVYAGLAGYARVTELPSPQGALFFELHVALNEPEGWFGGANVLRAKLPLVIEQNVRKLRRKLSRE